MRRASVGSRTDSMYSVDACSCWCRARSRRSLAPTMMTASVTQLRGFRTNSTCQFACTARLDNPMPHVLAPNSWLSTVESRYARAKGKEDM